MSNGLLETPPPRDARAIQYISHPDWPFHRLRDAAPGRYERPAPVALRRWVRLRIEVAGARASVFVDGGTQPVLVVDDLRHGPNAEGAIGLFVDDGTAAYFANLVVTAR